MMREWAEKRLRWRVAALENERDRERVSEIEGPFPGLIQLSCRKIGPGYVSPILLAASLCNLNKSSRGQGRAGVGRVGGSYCRSILSTCRVSGDWVPACLPYRLLPACLPAFCQFNICLGPHCTFQCVRVRLLQFWSLGAGSLGQGISPCDNTAIHHYYIVAAAWYVLCLVPVLQLARGTCSSSCACSALQARQLCCGTPMKGFRILIY